MSDQPAAGFAAGRPIGGDGGRGGSPGVPRGRSGGPASARVDAQGVRVAPSPVTAVTDSGQRPSWPPREPPRDPPPPRHRGLDGCGPMAGCPLAGRMPANTLQGQDAPASSLHGTDGRGRAVWMP